MITSIEIQGLRGIREGRIDGLAPLTILVGANGCGKSTVLEACGVACAGNSAADVFAALANREWLGLAGVRYWLSKGTVYVKSGFMPRVGEPPRETQRTTIILREVREGSVPVPGIDEPGPCMQFDTSLDHGGSFGFINADGRFFSSYTPKPLLPFALQTAFVDRPAGAAKRLTTAHFSSAHRDALTSIKLSPWYDELFSYLQLLRPGLISIESIAVGDRDEPHIFERDPKHGRVGYPLAYAGDGFRRSLLLAGTFARAKGGVAAVDEPEAFAHPGMFDALTNLLKRAVSDGTQVVLATHSLEFVAAALRAFEDQPEKAAVVGLRMESGVLDPLVVSGPDAHRRVLDLGHDLRL